MKREIILLLCFALTVFLGVFPPLKVDNGDKIDVEVKKVIIGLM